jgi:enoyl-CoA hydratase
MTDGDRRTVTTKRPEVLVDRAGSTLVMTINRPRQRNTMTAAAAHLIAGALEELDADDDLTITIRGGRHTGSIPGPALRQWSPFRNLGSGTGRQDAAPVP